MLNKEASLKALEIFFKKNKIGKITNLFDLLETKSRMSVFRRLQELNYLTSYSHAGKYYTLPHIANFNILGLWNFEDIRFSKLGHLKETVLSLIKKSKFGKTHQELENELHVRVHNTLLDLVKVNKITRVKMKHDYVYMIVNDTDQLNKQLFLREEYYSVAIPTEISDWIIIQILASIIRGTKSESIELLKIVSDLKSRKVIVTEEQVDQVLNKFDLKKTLD
jgi:hypothetical protein